MLNHLKLTTVALALGLVTTTALAQDTLETERHNITLNTVAEGLANPWGMAFINDTQALVTERPGRLRLVSLDGTLSQPISGVPAVDARNQGGLLDVAVDPDFANNGYVYLSFAEADANREGFNSTAVARGVLKGDRLENVEVIFSQTPKAESAGHFGSRLVFGPEGHLFITTGDRQRAEYMNEAQNLNNHIGTVIRIWPDGSVPKDNPFVGRDDAQPEIWSYGHRNVQGAAIHPETKELWTNEHGPRGGDEINIARAANNYGWPVASYGINYDGSVLTEQVHVDGTEYPHYYWVPSIATAGMMFYTGDKFPEWQGDLFVGALRGMQIARLDLNGERVMHEETLLEGTINDRIRDLEQGPDGFIYILTDNPNGRLLRLEPAK